MHSASHAACRALTGPSLTAFPQYTLLRNSRAPRRLFRASSSTFFFQLVLLLGLLLAAAPLIYVVGR